MLHTTVTSLIDFLAQKVLLPQRIQLQRIYLSNRLAFVINISYHDPTANTLLTHICTQILTALLTQ